VALKDIEAGDELFADYGSDYFNDLEGGCPCRSCNTQLYEVLEAEERECRMQQCQKDEDDKVAIAQKKKERSKKRKQKQKNKT